MRKSITNNILLLIDEEMSVDATLESTFDELGMDSLDRCTLYERIEKHYSIIIDDVVARDIRTVGELVNLVCEQVNV